VFRGIPTSLRQEARARLKFRFRFFASELGSEAQCDTLWLIGAGRSRCLWQGKVRVGEFKEFTIPALVIDDDGTVSIEFAHQQEGAGVISFPHQDGLELFYTTDSFRANYARGFFLIFTTLCFLSLLALFASTFLTFPVAALLCLYVMFLGFIADFLIDIFPTGLQTYMEDDSVWYFLSLKGLHSVFQLIPNFGTYSPVGSLAQGRMLEWTLLLRAVLELFLIRGALLLGGAGCFIFHCREIGNPLE
jgi:hypothetical protein